MFKAYDHSTNLPVPFAYFLKCRCIWRMSVGRHRVLLAISLFHMHALAAITTASPPCKQIAVKKHLQMAHISFHVGYPECVSAFDLSDFWNLGFWANSPCSTVNSAYRKHRIETKIRFCTKCTYTLKHTFCLFAVCIPNISGLAKRLSSDAHITSKADVMNPMVTVKITLHSTWRGSRSVRAVM
jgi:hypothetical protein